MAVTTRPQEAGAGSVGAADPVVGAVAGTDGAGPAARLTSEQVWRALAKASFAVVSHVTPAGAPRSSGVVYTTVGRRLYVATGPESWKARHIATGSQLAVTVPVRRGGLLSILLPIPPATISFHATAIVYPFGSAKAAESGSLAKARAQLESLLPEEGRDSITYIEIVPEGHFLTYGVGIPLMQMRSPAAAQARVPVREAGARRGRPALAAARQPLSDRSPN